MVTFLSESGPLVERVLPLLLRVDEVVLHDHSLLRLLAWSDGVLSVLGQDLLSVLLHDCLVVPVGVQFEVPNHRSVVAEVVVSSLVGPLVQESVVLDPQHSVAVAGRPHLLRGVVLVGAAVELVAGWKSDGTLHDARKELVLPEQFEQLVGLLELLLVGLGEGDCSPAGRLVVHVEAEVEVAEHDLDVVLVEAVSVDDLRVSEGLPGDVLELGHSLLQLGVAALEVAVGEEQGGVIEVEPDDGGTLVPHSVPPACLHH